MTNPSDIRGALASEDNDQEMPATDILSEERHRDKQMTDENTDCLCSWCPIPASADLYGS